MTSDFHMFRAHRVFHIGVGIITRHMLDVLKGGRFWQRRRAAFLDIVVEGGTIAYYFARGWNQGLARYRPLRAPVAAFFLLAVEA